MLCLNSSVLYTVYIFEKHSWTLVSRWRPRFTLTNILEWTQTHPWVWLVSDRCLVTQLTPIPRPFGSAVRVLDTALRSRRSTTESSPRPPPTTSISTFSHHLHSSTRGTESIHRCQWPQPRRASPYLQPVFLLLLLRVALRVLFPCPAPPCAGSVPVAFPPLGERGFSLGAGWIIVEWRTSATRKLRLACLPPSSVQRRDRRVGPRSGPSWRGRPCVFPLLFYWCSVSKECPLRTTNSCSLCTCANHGKAVALIFLFFSFNFASLLRGRFSFSPVFVVKPCHEFKMWL